MNWTPKAGTRALVTWIGATEALAALSTLVNGSVSGVTLVEDFWRRVLSHIGNGHADRLSVDPSGLRLAYWPRVWAARALWYLGDAAAGPVLIQGLSDSHWRVRMTCAQAIGRLRVENAIDELVEVLGDDHERVRAAAVTALGRVGDPHAIDRLRLLLGNSSDGANGRVERALKQIESRW